MKYLFFLYGFILLGTGLHAQDIAKLKHKRCMLLGKWQLVQTWQGGSLHKIEKHEYDGIICFKLLNHFYEEVNYESYHWKIKGTWKLQKGTDKLIITNRHYTLGDLHDKPENIDFHLFQLTKAAWAARGTTKGQTVEVYYQRLHK